MHLIRTILQFRSTFLRLEGTANHLFEPSNECLVSECATRALIVTLPADCTASEGVARP